MNKNILFLILVIIIAGGAYAFSINDGGSVKEEVDTHTHDAMHENDDMHHAMSVANDQEFIIEMIPHHQEAIDTAREVLTRGGVIPEVKTLAENIIEAQESEIDSMRSWYLEWFGEEVPNPGTYMAMMRNLGGLSGKELDIVFITDMIVHHEGALDMGNQALEFSEREEMINLSNNILRTQAEEIVLMKKILAEN